MADNNNDDCCTETYAEAYRDGRADQRLDIVRWVDEHRTYTELEAGIGIYRDHFSSEDLVKFLTFGKD